MKILAEHIFKNNLLRKYSFLFGYYRMKSTKMMASLMAGLFIISLAQGESKKLSRDNLL